MLCTTTVTLRRLTTTSSSTLPCAFQQSTAVIRSSPFRRGHSSSLRMALTRRLPAPLRRRWKSTSLTGSRRQKVTLAASEGMAGMGGSRRFLSDQLKEFLSKPRTIPVPRWITPQHYTITLSECLGHSSFILVAASYAVDDYLLLRMIAVVGSTAMLFFTYFHPHGRVLWLPFKWNLLFIATNLYRIGRVYVERFTADNLSEELLAIRDGYLFIMDPTDFAKLAHLARIVEYKKGDVVLTQGQENARVGLILDGVINIYRDGKITYRIGQANFISEFGLHAGLLLSGKVESCCTAVAITPVRMIIWNRDKLVELLRRDSGVRRSVQAALSWDLVSKLKAQRALVASIDDPEAWTERRTSQTEHRYYSILKNLLHHPHDLVERRKELNKYRIIHHIDDDFHNKALDLCGWTEEEFEAGHKDGVPDWSIDDTKVSLKDFVAKLFS